MLDKNQFKGINNSDSILSALKVMDEKSVKSLLVFDNDNFISMLTIGDIQRAIINNVSLAESIEKIIDFNKVYVDENESIDSIKNKMISMRAESMPVLNEKGDLVNVIFWNDIFDGAIENNREKLDLPVIIMAGGKGTRLKPLTNVIPKPLIPINEKTILELIIEKFQYIGCSKFYLSVNYKSSILKNYLKDINANYDIEYFIEDKPLGTIGSVFLLKNKINTPFFVSNCDILIDQDYRDVYDYHKENKNDITLVTAVKSYQIPYGVIETGKEGVMLGINEKPELSYMINTGVYILQPELINEIPENQFFHITDLIEKVKNRGGKIGCFPVSEKSWTDIGDWNEYLKLIR